MNVKSFHKPFGSHKMALLINGSQPGVREKIVEGPQVNGNSTALINNI